MPAPTFVDHDTQASGNGTSIVFSWTNIVGEADDDVAIAYLYKESTAAYTATPANWAQLAGFPHDQSTGGFRYRADVWWRRRAGDTGTATWSWSGSTWRSGRVLVYRGAIPTETPLVTVGWDAETAQNTQPSNPGITIARSNSGLSFTSWNFAASDFSTDPTGFTSRLEGDELCAFDDLTTTTGATGTVSGTMTDPEYASTVLLELATEAGGAAAQDTPELYGRPFGQHGQSQQQQVLAQ